MGWEVEADEAAVERYYARSPLPIRILGRELDGLVRAVVPDARCGIKWSVPFYARKGPLCYVSAAKQHVTLGLLHGADTPDASGRLVGTGKSPIRKATFRPGERLPQGVVRGWLRHARRLDETWGKD